MTIEGPGDMVQLPSNPNSGPLMTTEQQEQAKAIIQKMWGI